MSYCQQNHLSCHKRTPLTNLFIYWHPTLAPPNRKILYLQRTFPFKKCAAHFRWVKTNIRKTSEIGKYIYKNNTGQQLQGAIILQGLYALSCALQEFEHFKWQLLICINSAQMCQVEREKIAVLSYFWSVWVIMILGYQNWISMVLPVGNTYSLIITFREALHHVSRIWVEIH